MIEPKPRPEAPAATAGAEGQALPAAVPAAHAAVAHHVRSWLMRESLLDRQVERSTESAVHRMLPEAHVLKIGGRSIFDAGRQVVYPLVETLAACLKLSLIHI